MFVDTRRPVLVMIGAWNVSIFQNHMWVAKYLYGLKDGQQAAIAEYRSKVQDQTATFIGEYGIGYFATHDRLELYIKSFSHTEFQKLVDFVKQVRQVLPHTPIGDFGVNFGMVEIDPASDVLDRLQARDSLGTRFRIVSQRLSSKIDFEPGCELNLTRAWLGDAAVFDFNYHHFVNDLKSFEQINADRFMHLLDKTLTTIRQVYDIDDIDELSFDDTNAIYVEETEEELAQ